MHFKLQSKRSRTNCGPLGDQKAIPLQKNRFCTKFRWNHNHRELYKICSISLSFYRSIPRSSKRSSDDSLAIH